MHNDMGCAVSDTIMGVEAGATHIQGTINGLGERTGNADLVQIIPSLQLKLGCRVLKPDSLPKLKAASLLLYELSGLAPNPFQPFVGSNAFAHKGGIHSDAVLKDPSAYEHINPELVGNARRIVISELSGASSLVGYAKKLGIGISKSDARVKEALGKIKELERSGYSFDLAPESAILVLAQHLGLYKRFISVDYWKVISESGLNVAVVKANGMLGVAESSGPVGAIDAALRKASKKFYPEIDSVSLADYRVVIPGKVTSTDSTVRVTIELTDGKSSWHTMGVSNNIIEASMEGILDGMNYYLWKSKNPGATQL
jgi:2-isopropylmalate synthase